MRGKPKTHDEPQHKFQGQITIQQLNFEYRISTVNNENYPNFELMKKASHKTDNLPLYLKKFLHKRYSFFEKNQI